MKPSLTSLASSLSMDSMSLVALCRFFVQKRHFTKVGSGCFLSTAAKAGILMGVDRHLPRFREVALK